MGGLKLRLTLKLTWEGSLSVFTLDMQLVLYGVDGGWELINGGTMESGGSVVKDKGGLGSATTVIYCAC